MKVFLLSLFILFSSSPIQSTETIKKTIKTKKKKTIRKNSSSKKRRIIRKKRIKKRKDEGSYIDETQKFISDFWVNLNYNLDTYFSDQVYNKKENKSRILAYYEIFKREGSPLQKLFDIKVKVHFPKLSKRLSITIEKERDEILESRLNEATKNQATRQSDYNASLDYNFKDVPFFETKLRTGFKFTLPLDPFIKLKFWKTFNSEVIDIHFEQMFIYYRQDYFQEYTSLSFSKKLRQNLSISQNNSLSWSDSDDKWFARNSLSLNHRINDKIGMNYSAGANASFTPSFHYTSYDASIGYHQLLYKDWFFGNLSIGADFLRSNDWQMTNFVVARTEVLFH